MKLPLFVQLLGYSSLIPFFLVPLWMTLAPGSVPVWLDRLWATYIALIAAFMSGSFWGFALPAAQGPQGKFGLLISVLLVLATTLATAFDYGGALIGLGLVFFLLLIADFWRERTLDTIDGYFALRITLTVGVILALAWRYLLLPAG